VLVYRTGPITSAFFAEFADVLERVATNVDPLYIVGDLNIRLDRTDDAWSRQLTDLWASYGLACRVSAPTHDRGGLLDVVVSRDELPAPRVDIIDMGLSDHQLLCWSDCHLSIPPRSFALGTDSTPMRFGPVYERHCCARPMPGPCSTSMDWRSSTTPRSRCFWTSSFLLDPSHTIGPLVRR